MFLDFLRDLQLASNVSPSPLASYWFDEEKFVQDDYVLTSVGLEVEAHSQRIVEWAHQPDGGYHEPVAIRLKVMPKPRVASVSRRVPQFDRNKLQDPAVQEKIRTDLASIVAPPIHFEQSTRSHVLTQAVRNVIENAAPKERKPKRQHWLSATSKSLIEARDLVFKQMRRCGRAIQKCHELASHGGPDSGGGGVCARDGVGGGGVPAYIGRTRATPPLPANAHPTPSHLLLPLQADTFRMMKPLMLMRLAPPLMPYLRQ